MRCDMVFVDITVKKKKNMKLENKDAAHQDLYLN